MTIIDPIELSEQADAAERAIPCPACQGTLLSVLLTPADVEAERRWLKEFRRQRTRGADRDKELVAYTQAKPTFIVRCVSCGTVLRDPQPTCGSLRALYASDRYGKAVLGQLAASQDPFFRTKAERLKAYLPASATVLEVGSFVGSFLRAAGELGWRAVGVDVGAETVAYTREAGLEVIQGDIQETDLPLEAWDGIFIWNTFDQLCDPGQVLERAFALLREAGVLVLRIPNGDFEYGCLQLRRQGRGTRQAVRVLCAQAYNSFLSFPYLVGYTAGSLSKLLQRRGFTIEAIEGDTLVQLANHTTLPFSAIEEERYKRAVRGFCGRLEAATGRFYHPWLDLVARKGA